jgi:hypothetical protein
VGTGGHAFLPVLGRSVTECRHSHLPVSR